MRPLRIAVIGAGSIAQRYHLPSLQRLAEEGLPIERAAIGDVDAAKAAQAAARFGFRESYADYTALLDAVAPDAVWALVPFERMREVAGFFLAQGVPTLMEKPPGKNSQETQELLEIAQQRGTPHQVAFNRRHAPALQRMAALLHEAGEMRAVGCQFYRVRRREPYFAYGTGLHGLDALRYLAMGEVCELHTERGPRGSALVTLRYDDGSIGSMEMFPQVGYQSERYTGHAGERSVIVEGVIDWLTRYPGFLTCYQAGERILHEDYAATSPAPEVSGGFYGESKHFITCLLAGERPQPDLAEALLSVRLAEAVLRGESLVLH